MRSLRDLMDTQPRPGRVDWIGARPGRRDEMLALQGVHVTEAGLEGDHGRPGKRAVTLIQAEHLPVITALAGSEANPAILRRNLVISGINLASLRGRDVTIGGAILLITGPCAPCSRMEEALGPGGYQAMRHHGGWCASVTRPGRLTLGDAVSV